MLQTFSPSKSGDKSTLNLVMQLQRDKLFHEKIQLDRHSLRKVYTCSTITFRNRLEILKLNGNFNLYQRSPV